MDITKLLKSTPQQILLRFSNLDDLPIGIIESVASLNDTLNGGDITTETNIAEQCV